MLGTLGGELKNFEGRKICGYLKRSTLSKSSLRSHESNGFEYEVVCSLGSFSARVF